MFNFLSVMAEFISIHAPYKRVRRGTGCATVTVKAVFQSTHPTRECDASMDEQNGYDDIFQSTHPTRECDSSKPKVMSLSYGAFQSTHPTRECDTRWLWHCQPVYTFQSTHPTRECDQDNVAGESRQRDFNPRTLQESATSSSRHDVLINVISIHAPYKRVRPDYL